MKRFISLLLIAAMCFTMIGSVSAESQETPEIQNYNEIRITLPCFETIDSFEEAVLPFYMGSVEDQREITVYYPNGEKWIPYLKLEKAIDVLKDVTADLGTPFSFTMDRTENLEVYFRENGSCLQVMGNKICVSDIDRFVMAPNASNPFDLGEYPMREDGKQLIKSGSFQSVKGEWSIYDLDKYGLQLIWREHECYIPVQVFSDLFVSSLYVNLAYNDKVMIAMPYNGIKENPYDAKDNRLSALGKLFYDCEPYTKTAAHSQFTYNALCLALDANYGLMAEHGINDFDDLLSRSGITTMMMSGDPMNTIAVLYQLALANFADSHSACSSSQMPGSTGSLGDMASEASRMYVGLAMSQMIGGEINQKMAIAADLTSARARYYPDGPIGYEEVDDTAFITFDAFMYDAERDYYNTEITNNPNDTMELLLYAYRQITREDSPIKNVVLDLSNNGGGMAPMAIAASAWMLGNPCISAENVKNGAFGTVLYTVDFNLDGVPVIQESMKALGMNLYCLTSPSSFSCGNLVPAVLKASGQVTMIGRNSGGGACVVRSLTTADGAFFTVSGPTRLVTTMNGSRTSVEGGTEPDVYISKIEHLYDRPYMVNLIHDLP